MYCVYKLLQLCYTKLSLYTCDNLTKMCMLEIPKMAVCILYKQNNSINWNLYFEQTLIYVLQRPKICILCTHHIVVFHWLQSVFYVHTAIVVFHWLQSAFYIHNLSVACSIAYNNCVYFLTHLMWTYFIQQLN